MNLKGQPLYSNRYKYLEPFYNNVAYAITHNDECVLISESGEIVQSLHTHVLQEKKSVDLISSQITAYWHSVALMYFIQLDIIKLLPCSLNDLAVRIGVPVANLKRLISVIADLGYVEIEFEVLMATSIGETIKQNEFIKDAGNMWLHLSKIWVNGLNLLTSVSGDFPDFKSLETDPKMTRSYHKALIGYARHELPSYELLRALIKAEHTEILMVGRQSLPWASELNAKDTSINVEVYTQRWEKDPIDAQQYNFNVQNLRSIKEWPKKKFDSIFFIKLMMHYDDSTVESILGAAKDHLNTGGQIYIIEPVIGVNGSFSGLNLNMLFECGGKVRTTDEWQQLLMNSTLFITQHVTSGYNTIFRIDQDIRGAK